MNRLLLLCGIALLLGACSGGGTSSSGGGGGSGSATVNCAESALCPPSQVNVVQAK